VARIDSMCAGYVIIDAKALKCNKYIILGLHFLESDEETPLDYRSRFDVPKHDHRLCTCASVVVEAVKLACAVSALALRVPFLKCDLIFYSWP